MLWDIFISHASEDKDSVVRPLVNLLEELGLSVWFDEQQLRLGDKLSRRINEALSLSRFGVVILSESFLGKDYPQKELQSFLSRETSSGGYILPVLHQISHDEIKSRIPLLGDNLAVSTDRGLEYISKEIFRAVSLNRDGDQAPARLRYFPQFDFPDQLIALALQAGTVLLRSDTWKHLEPKRDMSNTNVWMGTDSPVLIKLLYDLYAPLMLFRQISYALRRTLSSFSLTQRYRFALLEASLRVLTNEQDIATSGNPLEYTPRVPRWREKRSQDPARYWWQGISEERLDKARSAFVREVESEINATMFSFQNFRSTYYVAFAGDAAAQKPLGLLANPLYGFTPTTRPVFFRVLLFWHVCFAEFLAVKDDTTPDTGFPMNREHFVSSIGQVEDAEDVDEVYDALDEYWCDFVRPRLSRFIKSATET